MGEIENIAVEDFGTNPTAQISMIDDSGTFLKGFIAIQSS